MKSKASTVDEYIAELEGERKQAISRLREIIKNTIPTFRESMKYGIPTYETNNGIFAFASQKQYISIYMHNLHRDRIIGKYKKELGKFQRGKECLRYRKLSDINFDTIRKVISEAYAS